MLGHTRCCARFGPTSFSAAASRDFIDDATCSAGPGPPLVPGASCSAGRGPRTDSSHVLLRAPPDGPERVARERGSGSPPSTPNHPLSCLHTHKHPEDQDPL